jgi:hypothetical protein
MARGKIVTVTMRVRIGESELEVSGPEDFVMKQIDAFKKEREKIVAPIASSQKTEKVAGIFLTDKKLSVNQFFRKIGTKTDVDRTLAAGYYLEKFDKYESFTAGEIRGTIRNAKINPPNNTNDSINSNIKKGLIMTAGDKDGKRAFVLTTDGEDVINEMQKQ